MIKLKDLLTEAPFNSMANVEQRAKKFLDGLHKISEKSRKQNAPNVEPSKFEITKGKKYWKVVRIDYGSKSVYAFIDPQDGNIYKPAGWTQPAKHARSNLFDDDYGLSAAGPYGMAYLR